MQDNISGMGDMHKTIPKGEQPVALVKHAKRGKLLLIVIAVLVLLAVVAAVVWFFVVNAESAAQKSKAEESLSSLVGVKSVQQGEATITSKFGYSVVFNRDFVTARGQVTKSVVNGVISGEEFTEDDILTPRSYSIVNIDVNKAVVNGAGIGYSAAPRLGILTNIRRDFFETRRAASPGLSDIELTVKAFYPTAGPGTTTTLVSREQETINGVVLEKLLYKNQSNSSASTAALTLQYAVVQNGRPYVLNVYYSEATKQGDLTPLVQVINSVKFSPPSDDVEYVAQGDGDPTKAQSSVAGRTFTLFGASDTTVSTPNKLAKGTDLEIVAKNQLAVVRVGTMDCFDFDLLSASGTAAFSATDACAIGVGSGSIVREDGMVSTNGHVVTMGPSSALGLYIQAEAQANNYKPLQDLLDYLVSLNIVSKAEAQLIFDDLKAGGITRGEDFFDAMHKIPASRYKVNKEAKIFAIQLSDTPIKVTLANAKYSFNFSKTVVEAKYIASNFDPASEKGLQTTTASDVALLSMVQKGTFPVVKIGKLTNLKPGDELTIVGFPAFVDGGVLTEKARTIPTATQGEVIELDTDGGSNKLLRTNVPIAQGNSGGPVFNDDGEAIGLATYVEQSASDPGLGVTKFAKYSLIRDIADFTALAAKQNITFNGTSKINDSWYKAITAYRNADYSGALSSFNTTKAAYGDHYLIGSLITAAEKELNTPQALFGRFIGYIVIVIIAALLIIGFLFIRHRMRGKVLVAQYGGMMPAGAGGVGVIGQQPVMYQQPYQAPQAYQQPVVPQQPPQVQTPPQQPQNNDHWPQGQ